MFNSIFGAMGQSALTGQGLYQNNPQALQNAYNNPQLANQQMHAYNQARMQNKARWMIDGVIYSNSREFAKALFPDDEEAVMMFILKYGE